MVVACLIVSPVLSDQLAAAAVPPGPPSPTTSQRVTATMMGMPLQFEANHGQVDAQVKFLARGKGYTLFLTPTESVMVLQQREATAEKDALTVNDPTALPKQTPIKQAVVRMKLEGANPSPAIDGMEQLPGIVNYFIGNDPAKWRTKIPTYAKVQYQEAYPGIDLAYYGNQGKLEYDFIVAPGADPNQIKLAFEGASEIKVAASGDLLLTTALGDVRLQKPVVYQVENNGHKTLVAGNYIASPKTSKAVQIQLAAYDRSKPVIIDPVLDYLTYLGGKVSDFHPRIAVDALGNAYIGGMTGSLDFPVTGGAYDPSFNANPACPGIAVTNTACIVGSVNLNTDYFVAKINPSATALLYATYIGGTGNDNLVAPIAVDSAGSAYLAGQTRSADFPVTPGAFQTTAHHSATCLPPSNCSADGFVTKLDPTGSSLMYSTYFGGNSGDFIYGITVDSGGYAYVTGDIRSNDFPITPGAFSATFGAGLLAKLNQTGTGLVWSTRLSIAGSGFHDGRAIALDSGGNVILVGGTQATIMPLVGAIQGAFGGISDAFVWKFNPTGTTLLFSTFLGGAGDDWAYGVAVDSSDNIYLTGYTESSNFPTTPGSYDTSYNGGRDIFITKLTPTGSSMIYSTFLGGTGVDENRGDIKVDSVGHAYVAGDTTSSDFPLVNPIDTTRSSSEVVLVKLKSDGSDLVYSTFLGGASLDSRPSIALGSFGTVYLAANTTSTDLTTTSGVFQPIKSGGEEIFIAKISDKPIANAGLDQSVPEGTLVTLDGTGSAGESLSYIWTRVAGPLVTLGGATSAHPTFSAPPVPTAGGTATFELVVCEGSSSNCSAPDSVNVHITNVNQPPVADAGPTQTVLEGSPVILNGTASFDPDVEPLTYQWTQILGPAVTLVGGNTATAAFTAPPVGSAGVTITFDLTVTDPQNLTGSAPVSVVVTNINQIPIANAGPSQTVNELTSVTLNGAASSDPDLDLLTYSWSQVSGPLVTLAGGTTAVPTFTAPNVGPGGASLTFQLVVSDGRASSASAQAIVNVQDVNDLPVCTAAKAKPKLLWPPNHKMVKVKIRGISQGTSRHDDDDEEDHQDGNDDQDGDDVQITITSVTQDEPINGLGDGDTSPDAAVSGNNVLLRAERAGNGNGRVYEVHFTATKGQGASCSGTVKVSVPRNKKDTAVDNGQVYNSFGP
jgi:hypothetical protein